MITKEKILEAAGILHEVNIKWGEPSKDLVLDKPLTLSELKKQVNWVKLDKGATLQLRWKGMSFATAARDSEPSSKTWYHDDGDTTRIITQTGSVKAIKAALLAKALPRINDEWVK